MAKDPNKYPPGWDQARVEDAIVHYDNQTEDEAVAEIEDAFAEDHATVEVPHELMPAVRDLIAKHKKAG